jgi:hypothetical protein
MGGKFFVAQCEAKERTFARLERSSGRYRAFFWLRVLLIESAAEVGSLRDATITTANISKLVNLVLQ